MKQLILQPARSRAGHVWSPGGRSISTGHGHNVQHKTEHAEQFASKEFHQAPDKVDAKAQVIFDTCWRRLESKLSQVSILLYFLLIVAFDILQRCQGQLRAVLSL